MSDICEMAANHKRFAEKTQPEAKACALTNEFNCVCPACARNDVGNAACKKADPACSKQGPVSPQ